MSEPSPLAPPLSAAELRRVAHFCAPLPRKWTANPRRRRLLLLGLAAPGFLAVAATPAHQNFFVLLAGLTAFAAAFVFRRLTEPMFVRAEAGRYGRPPRTSPAPSLRRTPDMRNRHSLTALGTVVALALASPPPAAHAQMAVIDLNAIYQAEQQVSQGLTQIQRLESQLSNQALMLQKMESDFTAPVMAIQSQATQILQQAQGIGYGAQNVASQFTALYPSGMPGASLATTQASVAQWRQQNSLALQQALQVQNQIAQAQPTVATQVQGAVAASQAAAGQTSAIQATNQLLATATAQLTQLQNILITQARAEQLIAAQAQASQATGAADSQRFWTITPTASRVQNPGQL